MNRTEKRQFLDEIEFLGKSQEFTSAFKAGLKSMFTLKSSPEKFSATLEDKRKAYNYAYTNIFRKYRVDHDDLYGDLDKIWNECITEKNPSKQREFTETLAVISSSRGGQVAAGAIALMSPIHTIMEKVGGAIVTELVVLNRVRKFWKSYKNAVRVFAEKYVESL
jgi:hypothetical protein